MEKIILNCEIVTPLLMHGADKKAELREQSFKGVMRFWWRAIHGNLDLKELREKEAEIFGDKQKKSSFRMKITNKKLTKINNQQLYNSITQNGIKYNFYSLIINKDQDSYESGAFNLEIFYKKEYEQELISTLNYVNFFGNFGARSRRGAGSIKFKNNKLLNFNGDSKEDLKNFINHNFVRHINNKYTTFAKHIYIFDPQDSWSEALELIAKHFKDFRFIHKSDTLETPNFGFPIRHRNGSIFQGGKIVNNKCKAFINRRGSPLSFKIFKNENNQFFPILVWFGGNLLPDNYKIVNKNNCKESDNPNEHIINNFINYLVTKGLHYEEI